MTMPQASIELTTCPTVNNASSDSATFPTVSPVCENVIQECARKFHAASGHAVVAAESLVQLIGPGKHYLNIKSIILMQALKIMSSLFYWSVALYQEEYI